MKLLTFPSVFPDFSVVETLAYHLKREFHAERTTTKKAALARFQYVFNEVA